MYLSTWTKALGAVLLGTILLSSCSKEQILEGSWLLRSEYQVIGSDTIFSRSPVLLNFEKGGTLLLVSFAETSGLGTRVDTLFWQKLGAKLDTLSGKKLGDILIIGNAEFSDTALLHSTSGSKDLHIEFKQGQHRLLRRLPPSSLFVAKELESNLLSKVWQLEAASMPMALDTNSLDIEFFPERYICTDVKQDFPFIWSIVNYGSYHFLLFDGLAGHLQSWDLVELTAHDNGAYTGRYYLQGKEQSLRLSPSPRYANRQPNPRLIEGSWQARFDDSTELSPAAKEAGQLYEEFLFLPNGELTRNSLGKPYRGKWSLSKTGNFLLIQEEQRYYSIRIAEMLDNGNFLGSYRCDLRQGLDTRVLFERKSGEN